MLTENEFESVLSDVRNGCGLRQALINRNKFLDKDMQAWFTSDPDREKRYLSAKNEANKQ